MATRSVSQSQLPKPAAPPANPNADDDASLIGKAYDPRIGRRLFSYVRPYAWNIAAAILFMTVAMTGYVAGPYLIGLALNNGIERRDPAALAQAVGLYILAAAVFWVGTFIRIRIMAATGQNIIYDMRRQLFDHLQALSMGFYNRYAVGRLVSRLVNDVSTIREFVVWAIIAVARDFFDLIGISVAMFLLNWQLALLSFLVLPLMAVATELFRRRARQSYRQVRSAVGWVNAVLNENIVGVRVVQSFSREDRNLQHFADQVNGNLLRATNYAALITALFFPSVDFIGSLALALVVYAGGQIFLGQVAPLWGFEWLPLKAGDLVAFALYIDRFFDPIRDLSQRYNVFQATMVSGERVFELLDTPVEVNDSAEAREMPPLRGQVEYRNVGFKYDPAGLPILEQINLHVQPGETVAFVGETGAGKSTMVKLLSRFHDVTEGALLIDGVDVRTVTQNSLRRQMGVVLQEPFLFSGTVRENIAYGNLDADEAAIEAAARAVGAHDFVAALDHGYDTKVGEGGAILSGGQRQLISFARALLA
ncbi:MAG: ABC transporter ATP-binding protein, partial [Anaerolineales bacterium]